MKLDRAKRASTSQYCDGEPFESVEELCLWLAKNRPIRVSGRTHNAFFARNQQLGVVLGWIARRRVCRAVFAPSDALMLRAQLRKKLRQVEKFIASEVPF